MIVLEGVDRCGKTTVARNILAKYGGFSYRHFTYPGKIAPTYRYYAWQTADAHPAMILDRLHLSDWSYGHVYRNGPDMTYREWQQCELMLHTCGALQVVMTDEPEAIYSRWGAEEMYGRSLPNITALVERYREQVGGGCARATTLPTIVLTLPEVQEPRDLDLLVRNVYYAPSRHYLRRAWRPASLVLGSPTAKFLVLGDAPPVEAPPKDEQGSDPDLPFSRGEEADTLWAAFGSIGLRWWEGSYAYASSFATPARFAEFAGMRRGHLRRVYCVGEQARTLFKAAWNSSDFHDTTWSPIGRIPSSAIDAYDEWKHDLAHIMAQDCDVA